MLSNKTLDTYTFIFRTSKVDRLHNRWLATSGVPGEAVDAIVAKDFARL